MAIDGMVSIADSNLKLDRVRRGLLVYGGAKGIAITALLAMDDACRRFVFSLFFEGGSSEDALLDSAAIPECPPLEEEPAPEPEPAPERCVVKCACGRVFSVTLQEVCDDE